MPLNSGKYSLQQHCALIQVSGLVCCYSLERKLLGHKLQDSQFGVVMEGTEEKM